MFVVPGAPKGDKNFRTPIFLREKLSRYCTALCGEGVRGISTTKYLTLKRRRAIFSGFGASANTVSDQDAFLI